MFLKLQFCYFFSVFKRKPLENSFVFIFEDYFSEVIEFQVDSCFFISFTPLDVRCHSLSSNFHSFCFEKFSSCLKAMHPFSLVAVKIFSLSFIFYNLFSSFSITYYSVTF